MVTAAPSRAAGGSHVDAAAAVAAAARAAVRRFTAAGLFAACGVDFAAASLQHKERVSG